MSRSLTLEQGTHGLVIGLPQGVVRVMVRRTRPLGGLERMHYADSPSNDKAEAMVEIVTIEFSEGRPKLRIRSSAADKWGGECRKKK